MKTNSGPGELPKSPENQSEEENESQATFLLAAFQDTQGVIRATDSKVAALSFALAVPITKFESIWDVCAQLLSLSDGAMGWFARAIVLIFGISWITSVTAALRTLLQIGNPAQHIGGDTPSGVFYSPNLFHTNFLHTFFPGRRGPKPGFNAFFEKLPSNDLAVRRELAFELMKAVYIRTIKLQRAKVTYLALCTWLLSGGIIWITTLALSHHGK